MNIKIYHGRNIFQVNIDGEYIGFIQFYNGELIQSDFMKHWLEKNPMPSQIKEAELMLRVKNI